VLAVGLVDDLAGTRAAVDLFATVWATEPGGGPVRAELVWAMAVSGAYVATARSGARVVGASLGWIGLEERRAVLHSHITAVDPSYRGTGVGLALKRHQREWCIERAVGEARWTFDPLVRRNAWFNLTRLGATVLRYAIDFYGEIDDSVNRGDDSDRVVVAWDVHGPKAKAAANDDLAAPDADAIVAAGGSIVLASDEAGGPVVTGTPTPGAIALCATPADIEALRRHDPAGARGWRRALRDVLGGALDLGWRVVGITRSGFYVLESDGSP